MIKNMGVDLKLSSSSSSSSSFLVAEDPELDRAAQDIYDRYGSLSNFFEAVQAEIRRGKSKESGFEQPQTERKAG